MGRTVLHGSDLVHRGQNKVTAIVHAYKWFHGISVGSTTGTDGSWISCGKPDAIDYPG